MSIRLQFDRIPPGVEIGPHRHGVETIVFVAGGEIVFEHGERLERRVVLGTGDVLYEAAAEYHLVRNEGPIDALALLATNEAESVGVAGSRARWRRDDEPVRRHENGRVSERGGILERILVDPGAFGTTTFMVAEVVLGPGISDAWHRHPESEQVLVVFEGRGVVTVGDITETLEPLTGIRIEPGLVHRVENTGRTRLRYYVCGSPGTDPVIDRVPAEAPPHRLDAEREA